MRTTTTAITIALAAIAVVLGWLFFGAQGSADDDPASHLRRFYQTSSETTPPEPIVSAVSTAPESGAVSVSSTLRVPILVYHSVRPFYAGQMLIQKHYDVEPAIFERQLQYLSDNKFIAISFDQLLDALEKRATLPPKAVIITFDDGWENQYVYALPLLKKYGLTATFFVWTKAIGHRHFLTWDELRKLAAAGMTIGSHSVSHPTIAAANKKNLRAEIYGSKETLEKQLGIPIQHFAYPFGSFNDRVVKMVKEAGYKTARALSRKREIGQDLIFRLPGAIITENFIDFENLVGK